MAEGSDSFDVDTWIHTNNDGHNQIRTSRGRPNHQPAMPPGDSPDRSAISLLGKRARSFSFDSDATESGRGFISDGSDSEAGFTLDLTATSSPGEQGANDNSNGESSSGTPNTIDCIDSNAYAFLMEAGLDEAALASLGIDLEEIKAQQRLERQAQADLDYARQVQEQLDIEARLEREQRERERIATDAAIAAATAMHAGRSSSNNPGSSSSSSSSSTPAAAASSSSVSPPNPLRNSPSIASTHQPQQSSLPASTSTPTVSTISTMHPTSGLPQYVAGSLGQPSRPPNIPQIPTSGNLHRSHWKQKCPVPRTSINNGKGFAIPTPTFPPPNSSAASGSSSSQTNRGGAGASYSSASNSEVIDLTDDSAEEIARSESFMVIDEDYDSDDPMEGVQYAAPSFNPLLNSWDVLLEEINRERMRALPRTFAGTNIPISPALSFGKPFYPSDYARPLNAQKTEEELRALLENISDDSETLTEAERAAIVPGLGVTLLEHQQIGLRWMTKMETSPSKGGMLLDDMGFGKTIQALATIVSRPCSDFTPIDQLPMMRKAKTRGSPELSKSKATLVVCPVSLVAQWAREIISKTRPSLNVCIYHGPNRPSDPTELAPYDVIVTAYTTLSSDLPIEEDRRGPLGRLKFHRVILDEAHTIKNRNTQMAAACCRLESTYRWCLTATPIQNKIEELYSLLKFLRVRPYCEWAEFRMHIQKPLSAGHNRIGLKRVQALMKAIALRRTKKATINGRPIITLPERTVHMTHVNFSEDERKFYDFVDKRAQASFNRYVNAGTVMKNYSSVLVLLLRLRQACLHPSLTMIEAPEIDHEAVAKAKEEIARAMDKTVVERLVKSNDLNEIECPICMDMADQAQINFSCGHIMCRECLAGYLNSNAGSQKRCPQCRRDIDPEKTVPVEIFVKVHAPELYGEMEAVADESKPAKRGSDFISSTKIEKLIEILHETREQTNNQDKTIVFSQFTAFLDLLERPLTEAGFKFVRFDGTMNVAVRDRMLTTFKQDPDVTVLLVSTKCGSLGLNLTEANRVVMMDIWWNPALENQAIDRVHRIGQMKDVVVHRIFINNTVEDRILELQRKKQALADGALGDAASLRLGRLGLNELLHLFRGTGLHDDTD